MTRQTIMLVASEHPALSFVASQRVQAALGGQPRYTAVTAAKLVSEIVADLTGSRALHALELDVCTALGRIKITLNALDAAANRSRNLDGLARLLLDRLAHAWGGAPGGNRFWFELSSGPRRTLSDEVARR